MEVISLLAAIGVAQVVFDLIRRVGTAAAESGHEIEV